MDDDARHAFNAITIEGKRSFNDFTMEDARIAIDALNARLDDAAAAQT